MRKRFETVASVRLERTMRTGGGKYLPLARLVLRCGHEQVERLHYRSLVVPGSRRVCWECSRDGLKE